MNHFGIHEIIECQCIHIEKKVKQTSIGIELFTFRAAFTSIRIARKIHHLVFKIPTKSIPTKHLQK